MCKLWSAAKYEKLKKINESHKLIFANEIQQIKSLLIYLSEQLNWNELGICKYHTLK